MYFQVMPKAKTIPTPVKKAIVQAKEAGQSNRAVAKLFGISNGAVSTIYNRHLSGNDLHRKPKSGRPRILNSRDVRVAICEIRMDPTKNASDLVAYASMNFGKNLSKRTGRRILNEAQSFAHRPAYKPMISKNRLARLAFARRHQNFTSQVVQGSV